MATKRPLADLIDNNNSTGVITGVMGVDGQLSRPAKLARTDPSNIPNGQPDISMYLDRIAVLESALAATKHELRDARREIRHLAEAAATANPQLYSTRVMAAWLDADVVPIEKYLARQASSVVAPAPAHAGTLGAGLPPLPPPPPPPPLPLPKTATLSVSALPGSPVVSGGSDGSATAAVKHEPGSRKSKAPPATAGSTAPNAARMDSPGARAGGTAPARASVVAMPSDIEYTTSGIPARFPVQVDDVSIVHLGRIMLDSRWSVDGVCFPNGYQCKREWPSAVHPGTHTTYTCAVQPTRATTRPAPVFSITAADDPDHPYEASHPTDALAVLRATIAAAAANPLPQSSSPTNDTEAVAAVAAAAAAVGAAAVGAASVLPGITDGAAFFALAHPVVLAWLQRLPSAEKIKWARYFVADPSTPAVGGNGIGGGGGGGGAGTPGRSWPSAAAAMAPAPAAAAVVPAVPSAGNAALLSGSVPPAAPSSTVSSRRGSIASATLASWRVTRRSGGPADDGDRTAVNGDDGDVDDAGDRTEEEDIDIDTASGSTTMMMDVDD